MQLLTYRLRSINIVEKKKKFSFGKGPSEVGNPTTTWACLLLFSSVCRSVTVMGVLKRKLQQHLRRTMSFTSLSGSPDVSPGASMVQ